MEKLYTEKEIIDIVKKSPSVWYNLPLERDNIIKNIKNLKPAYKIVCCNECAFGENDSDKIDLYWCNLFKTLCSTGDHFCKRGVIKNDKC